MRASTTTMECPCCHGQVLTEFWTDEDGVENEHDLACLGPDSNGNDCQWTDTRIVPCIEGGCPALIDGPDA